MFGNKIGWFISLLLFLLGAYGFYLLAIPVGYTAPTGALDAAMEPIKLPIDPKTLVPPGTDDCDAGTLYKQAIADYEQNTQAYKEFGNNIGGVSPEGLKGLDLVAQAAKCGRMTLFADNLKAVINYKPEKEKPDLVALDELGRLTAAAGAKYADNGDKRKGEQFMDGAFILGEHLVDERITFEELRIGIVTMTNAAGLLAKYGPGTDDADRRRAFNEFDSKTSDYNSKTNLHLIQDFSGIGKSTLGVKNGDVFKVAADGRERMWRVEAILKMGRYRWEWGGSDYANDQRYAVRTLDKMVNDPNLDPVVHAAAVTAHDLTKEDYEKING